MGSGGGGGGKVKGIYTLCCVNSVLILSTFCPNEYSRTRLRYNQYYIN